MSSRVLVDTSAWADFLRRRGRAGEDVLRLVAENRLWLHPIVIGEVLLGGVDLADGRLGKLPVLDAFPATDVLAWLRGQDASILRGVGWADCAIVHAAVTERVPLLSSDTAQNALYIATRPPG
jgi:predicted nucleic acid-binding protein